MPKSKSNDHEIAPPSLVTPGPWSTDPEAGHQSVLGSDGVMVADCSIVVNPKYGKRTDAINVANAKIISAAPDLLAALEASQQCIANLRLKAHPVFCLPDDPVWAANHAAIAKARGRS